jgi:hypothetical protein
MALVLLNNNGTPFGQFDGYDSLLTTMLGGEVATLVAYDSGVSTDLHAADVNDGYVRANLGGGVQLQRPIATTVLTSTSGPLFLTDDGTTNYGTLFGSLVGSQAGQVVTGGTSFGPSTMAGSGKVTLWSNPGLYGVTLDALDQSPDGFLTTNTALFVGMKVAYQTADGKLTPDGSNTDGTVNVGRLVEFSQGDTLVTTPRSLTRVGVAGGTLAFKYIVINWSPVQV